MGITVLWLYRFTHYRTVLTNTVHVLIATGTGTMTDSSSVKFGLYLAVGRYTYIPTLYVGTYCRYSFNTLNYVCVNYRVTIAYFFSLMLSE